MVSDTTHESIRNIRDEQGPPMPSKSILITAGKSTKLKCAKIMHGKKSLTYIHLLALVAAYAADQDSPTNLKEGRQWATLENTT